MKVKLRVYDISNGKVKRWAPWLIGKNRSIGGIWHTGILVYGWEYFYGGCGIEKMRPEDVLNELPMTLNETIDLGETHLSHTEFERWVLSIQAYFGPKEYDLIQWNCNSFSDCIARKLLPDSEGLPSYISEIVSDVEKSARGRAIIRILKSVGNLLDPSRSHDCACPNCTEESKKDFEVPADDLAILQRTKARFTPSASVPSKPISSIRQFCAKIPDSEFSLSDDEVEWQVHREQTTPKSITQEVKIVSPQNDDSVPHDIMVQTTSQPTLPPLPLPLPEVEVSSRFKMGNILKGWRGGSREDLKAGRFHEDRFVMPPSGYRADKSSKGSSTAPMTSSSRQRHASRSNSQPSDDVPVGHIIHHSPSQTIPFSFSSSARNSITPFSNTQYHARTIFDGTVSPPSSTEPTGWSESDSTLSQMSTSPVPAGLPATAHVEGRREQRGFALHYRTAYSPNDPAHKPSDSMENSAFEGVTNDTRRTSQISLPPLVPIIPFSRPVSAASSNTRYSTSLARSPFHPHAASVPLSHRSPGTGLPYRDDFNSEARRGPMPTVDASIPSLYLSSMSRSPTYTRNQSVHG